jgi:hypothetical protein
MYQTEKSYLWIKWSGSATPVKKKENLNNINDTVICHKQHHTNNKTSTTRQKFFKQFAPTFLSIPG